MVGRGAGSFAWMEGASEDSYRLKSSLRYYTAHTNSANVHVILETLYVHVHVHVHVYVPTFDVRSM